MDISQKLRTIRESKNVSVEELSVNINVSIATINEWESGRSLPNVSDLVELSHFFEMPVDKIIYNDDEVPVYNEAKAVFYNSEEEAKKRKKMVNNAAWAFSAKASMVIIPIILMIVYVCLGAFFNLWHPGWIVLLAIPVYFALLVLMDKLGKDVSDAVDEYITDNEKRDSM